MIGTKFVKGEFTDEEYASCAEWCNDNQGATIEDKGDYYECVAVVVPLEDVKADKVTQLKSARDSAERTPVVTDKGTFDVDSVSLERINGAITVLKISGSSLEWTLADNTVVSVTADDLTNVIVALAQQSNSVHEKYRLLKERVESCTTADEVEAITWDTQIEVTKDGGEE